MNERVLVLGAGFGGLELSTMLSEAGVEATLIDCSDAFVFGYSKLDVMVGRTTADAVRLSYSALAKPGVRLLRETVVAIDPESCQVTTDAGRHDADFLVVALGASLRAPAKLMCGLSGAEAEKFEIPTGIPLIIERDGAGNAKLPYGLYD